VDLMSRSNCKLWTERRLEAMGVERILEVNKFVYDGRMYESNIWELLPRLKVFTFQWDVYTRSGYEEYSGKAEK